MILKQLRNNFDILNAAMNANKLKGKVDRIVERRRAIQFQCAIHGHTKETIVLRSNKKNQKTRCFAIEFS